ncbi:MAG: hypothetical protein DLD55_00680 [candidate division SR1 bacterium]|nr:MAG: hypothetical protein DLD55_00680 [candidate division SR1 bacterium]
MTSSYTSLFGQAKNSTVEATIVDIATPKKKIFFHSSLYFNFSKNQTITPHGKNIIQKAPLIGKIKMRV